jgi:hypothetical protein
MLNLSTLSKMQKSNIRLKGFFYILFFLTGTFCKAQDYKKCIVYQFAGNDSNKKHIALRQTFNRRGQVVSETYSNYKRSSKEGNSDGTYYYYYTNNILTKRLFIHYNKDTSKVLYYYNVDNQCIREDYFNCERRLKEDVKRDVVFDADFEKNRTWMKTNEVTYSYDDKGRKIKKTDGQDYDRLWKYDEQNRIIQEKGYGNDNKLAYVEDYQYFDKGYKYSTVYYDFSGDPKPPRYSDIEFSPIYTSTFYLDKKGRVFKQEITTEKSIKISSEITYYDTRGRIVKTLHQYVDEHFLNLNEQAGIIHIFQYE